MSFTLSSMCELTAMDWCVTNKDEFKKRWKLHCVASRNVESPSIQRKAMDIKRDTFLGINWQLHNLDMIKLEEEALSGNLS